MPLPAILHEDESLIAFDKPSGQLVAPDRWDKSHENLMELVRARMGRNLSNVHRLDEGTSGIVLCAKNKAALDHLSGQFQAKTVEKLYQALVQIPPVDGTMKRVASFRTEEGGLLAAFDVDLALGEDQGRPGRMRVFRGRGAKASLTQFRVLEGFGRFALLECRPLTGRTHQIRVHLAAAGAPILNDPLYGDPEVRLLLSDLKRWYKGRGDERPLISRLALHACELGFVHPVTRERMTVRSPLPHDFEMALKYLRRFAHAGR